MKLQLEYPNFLEALMFIISDKRPCSVSNDKKKLAYQVPLSNFKRGFDFYELNRAKDGSVFFTIVTMVGFKTVCETNSKYHYYDLSVEDWQNEIFDIVFKHFNKEEYVALKKGYIKKGRVVNQSFSFRKSEELDLEDIKDKPFDTRLEYLRNKPRKEWSKIEKFMKSSDDFLKLSFELNQKKNNKGCMLLFVFLLFSALIIKSSLL